MTDLERVRELVAYVDDRIAHNRGYSMTSFDKDAERLLRFIASPDAEEQIAAVNGIDGWDWPTQVLALLARQAVGRGE